MPINALISKLYSHYITSAD